MANVRKLPKLCSKRKMLTGVFRDDDRHNLNLASPFKQLKFSPVSKATDRILFINGGGQLKLSVYVNFGHLTVEVLEGRHFSSKWKTVCSSYVKLSLVPDDNKRSRCKTNIVQDTNHPTFNGKFSFELTESDHDKRLLVSTWHKDEERRCSEFLGCMSFGIKSIISATKTINGWYYLLTEDVGRKKHLQATNCQPQIKLTNQGCKNTSDSVANLYSSSSEPITLLVKRGRSGFGFSMKRSAGCIQVSDVEEASHAQHSGLQTDDRIVKVNGHSVAKFSVDSVAKLIKQSSKTIVMDVLRPVVVEHNSLCKQEHHLVEDKENMVPQRPLVVKRKSSSMNSLHRCHTELTSAIQHIMDCEELYISTMQHGIQHYSRPLRHRIVSSQQHQALFQNIEKLVTMSEFNLRQLTDIATGNSKSKVGKVYKSKMGILSEAYQTYFSGLQSANQTLSQLRGNSELEHFLQENKLESDELSIAAFIQRPSSHMIDLLRNMQVLLSWTPADHPDHSDLLHVVKALQKTCDSLHQNTSDYSSSSWKGSCGSLGSDSTGSLPSLGGMSHLSSSSHTSTSSVDSEVLELQQRLLWAEGVLPMTLATHGRHVIFAGELFIVEEKILKVWAILLSDVLLLTRMDSAGHFTVICDPINIHEISHKDFNQQNGSQFTLAIGLYKQMTRAVVLRAPSVEQKFVWKSIMEHRLSSTQFLRDSDLLAFRNGDHVEDFGVL